MGRHCGGDNGKKEKDSKRDGEDTVAPISDWWTGSFVAHDSTETYCATNAEKSRTDQVERQCAHNKVALS